MDRKYNQHLGKRKESDESEDEVRYIEDDNDRSDNDEDEMNRLAPIDDEDGEDFDEDENGSSHDSIQDREVSWQDIKVSRSVAPDPLTITHVNQTRDLLAVQSLSAACAENQTSQEWLVSHGLEHLHLQLHDLVDKGQVGRPQPDESHGKAVQHIQFDSFDVHDFEYKLNQAIDVYTKRIKWLLQGSKRMFGLIKGERVAVCVDVSNANCGFGRLSALQESLMHLVDEQLSTKKSIYLMSFGTDVEALWQVVRDNNPRILEEGKEWVMRLKQGGGCNFLGALKHILRLKGLDSVCLILGSVTDQSSELLCDYVEQAMIGQLMPLHTVAYDCSSYLTNMTLRSLSSASQGRYHCYTATSEEQIYSGTDISLLLKEIQKAQDVINRIKEMRQGMMGTALVNIINEISSEVAKLPQSRFLPRPPGHDLPLRVDVPKFQARTSPDWLRQQGLKAKRLDLYQILAPNSYPYKEDFIPVIKKAVQSQVYEKAMVQFTWHDGSVRNVHVDLTQLFEYQKRLGAAVRLYERRIDWLSAASRRIFGTVTENNIVILVDLSVSNVKYLVHIQHSLRLLLEQQIANKEYFNIIGFGSDVKPWRPTLVKPTLENLQNAWKWVLNMQCEGSRNFLAAFRETVENDEQIKHAIHVQGIYVFTSGVPDQSHDVASAFIQQSSSGTNIKLHTILFNVDDYDCNGAIPGRYANITHTAECLRNMAHCCNGRFHWFRETGIIESDDIQCVTAEIDHAINYSRKCLNLVGDIKAKYKTKYNIEYPRENAPLTLRHQRSRSAPRQATLTAAQNGGDVARKAIGWRPSSATRCRPPSASGSHKARSRPSSASKVITSSFFLEQKTPTGDATGNVYKKYPVTKSVRKAIREPTIPNSEDPVTTKQWLRLYSVSKLKLDLTKLMSGPDCKHVERNVKTLQKPVSAKYCHIFPSVNVNGTIKHLQLLPHELIRYESKLETVLKRYLRRLQWLLSGSRLVFGTVVEKKVAILVDTSGSMNVHLGELKKELTSLIWDQLHPAVRFNLIQFSSSCLPWRDSIVPSTEPNCHDAIKWLSEITASGNTCTLDALTLAFADEDIEAVYLISDGKPDTSTSKVLRQVAEMNDGRNIRIHTASFNSDDSTANEFLQLLARQTGGRYHRRHAQFDGDVFTHKLLSQGFGDPTYPHLPQFEGDDMRRLAEEITLARNYSADSRKFRQMYAEQTRLESMKVKENIQQNNVTYKRINVGRVH